MNEFFKKLKQESLNTKLSQNEKQYMRMALHNAIKNSPVVVPDEIYTIQTRRVSVKSSYVWFSPQFALPVALFLIVGLGTGTAYASQAALPGDALYSIKINVTEPAIGALAISDEAKAQWHAEVAETRLEEAETLAVSGKLTVETSEQISQNFDEHRSAAKSLAQKVEDENPGSGADLEAELDSSLEAHDAILVRVSNSTQGSSKQATENFAAHVRERGSVALALAVADVRISDDSDVEDSKPQMPMAMMASTGTEATTSVNASATLAAPAPTSAKAKVAPTIATSAVMNQSSSTSVQSSKALLKLKKSAGSALADAKTAFGNVKSSLDASTTLKINTEISRIATVVNATSSTSASLTAALKDATVLKAFLKASKNLKQNFFIRASDNSSKVDDQKSNQKGGKGSDEVTVVSTTSANSSAALQTPISTNSGNSSATHDANDDKGQNSGSGKGEDESDDGSSLVHNLLNSI